MTEDIRRSLSNLLDNEADDLELRRLLKNLDDDTAAVWSRYQLASAVLRGERPDARIDISARVMDGLGEMENAGTGSDSDADKFDVNYGNLALVQSTRTESVAGRKAFFGWKPVTSVAVAASVAAVVMFGVQQPAGLNDSGAELAQVSGPISSPSSDIVLPAPVPASGLIPAHYGRSSAAEPSALSDKEVIRLSSDMGYYLDQHFALMQSKPQTHQPEHWQAAWLPEGYEVMRYDAAADANVILYTNGQSTLSVSVEPIGMQKSAPGVVQSGDTVALGKQVNNYFVTVVGDVSLATADQIADSVKFSPVH